MPPADSLAYRARWILPIDRPPLENGVVIVNDGRIAEVTTVAPATVIELENAVLLPGLVNAHTHLEFSGLTHPLGRPGQVFPEWIGEVVAHRRQNPRENDEAAAYRAASVAAGLQETAEAHVALVGEIAPLHPPREIYDAAEARGVLFLELLGLGPERADALYQAAVEHVGTPGGWIAGFSPHAPYTVNPDLLAWVCQLSADRNVPVAMHLAESYEELELLAAHSGPFVTLLESLEAWRPEAVPRGLRPLDYLDLLANAARSLVIHGNFLTQEEIAFLARRRETMSVIYCPRTHAYFHAGEHPLPDLLAAGVPVALGTDSRASNPDLSLWEEMQFVRRKYPQLSAAEILRMGTLGGAEALGLAADYGSLTPGKIAAFAVLPLHEMATFQRSI